MSACGAGRAALVGGQTGGIISGVNGRAATEQGMGLRVTAIVRQGAQVGVGRDGNGRAAAVALDQVVGARQARASTSVGGAFAVGSAGGVGEDAVAQSQCRRARVTQVESRAATVRGRVPRKCAVIHRHGAVAIEEPTTQALPVTAAILITGGAAAVAALSGVPGKGAVGDGDVAAAVKDGPTSAQTAAPAPTGCTCCPAAITTTIAAGTSHSVEIAQTATTTAPTEATVTTRATGAIICPSKATTAPPTAKASTPPSKSL